jgi:hypothetical protein
MVSSLAPKHVVSLTSSDRLVRILDSFKFISDLCSYESVLFIHQDLYPVRLIDAEVSDSSHNGQDDPKGSDDGCQGAPSSEPTDPNPIGSGMAEQVCPSAADQLTTAAPLSRGPSKKKRLVLASKRKQPAHSDQVTTELFPHHAPRSSPGLVEVKLVFRCLFEALQHPAQVAQMDTSAGADTQSAKMLRVLPMRKMLMTKYITVFTCALLLVTFLNSHDSFVRKKPSATDLSKKLAQPASSSHATPVAPPAGVTGSTTLPTAEAWDYCRWVAEILEGLKNREVDHEGNPFTPSLFHSFNLLS